MKLLVITLAEVRGESHNSHFTCAEGQRLLTTVITASMLLKTGYCIVFSDGQSLNNTMLTVSLINIFILESLVDHILKKIQTIS